ncbi:DNA-binding transcriptional regulator FruR [Pseudomonas putida BIRD-1]|nr:DNA-binding transcriptional regulator FruR [Pseudomonas putida BIRD-1]
MKLSDIARLAGVSVTTASYVINGKAEQQRISNSTVERVRAVVEAHGFTPTRRLLGCAAGIPAPWASFSRIWRTPATPALPSNWSKAHAPAATSC